MSDDHSFDALAYQMQAWQKDILKKLMEQESMGDYINNHLATPAPMTATEIMMQEKERQYVGRYQYGGRGHGKSVTGRWSSTNPMAILPTGLDDLRPARKDPVAFPTGLFQGQSGEILIMDDMPAPTTTQRDRQYLCLTVSEYQSFSEAVMSNCYLDRDGNHCKLKNAKLKKLKNLRHKIKKSEFLSKSMIWKEQLRVIEQEILKRQKISRGQFS